MSIHFEKRYPLNSRVGRIAASFFLIASILIGLFALSRSREFDRRLAAGELVELQATVQRITVTGKDKDAEYDVWASYTYDGKAYENVHLNWYSSNMEEGQPAAIYISPNAPETPCNDPADFLRLAVPTFLGVSVLCSAIAWFPRRDDVI